MDYFFTLRRDAALLWKTIYRKYIIIVTIAIVMHISSFLFLLPFSERKDFPIFILILPISLLVLGNAFLYHSKLKPYIKKLLQENNLSMGHPSKGFQSYKITPEHLQTDRTVLTAELDSLFNDEELELLRLRFLAEKTRNETAEILKIHPLFVKRIEDLCIDRIKRYKDEKKPQK